MKMDLLEKGKEELSKLGISEWESIFENYLWRENDREPNICSLITFEALCNFHLCISKMLSDILFSNLLTNMLMKKWRNTESKVRSFCRA